MVRIKQTARPIAKSGDPRSSICNGPWAVTVNSSTRLKSVQKEYYLPDGYQLVSPGQRNVTDPPPDCIAVYRHAFVCGLRFPLHPFIMSILEEYQMALAQFNPNSWPNVLALIAICALRKREVDMEVFLTIFRLKWIAGTSSGWFTVSRRNGFMTVLDKRDDIKNWKNEFVFVRREGGWKLPLWNDAPTIDRQSPDHLPDNLNKLKKMFGCQTIHIEVDHEERGDDGVWRLVQKKEPFLIPNHWVPDYTFLQDEIFLSACDLSMNVRPIEYARGSLSNEQKGELHEEELKKLMKDVRIAERHREVKEQILMAQEKRKKDKPKEPRKRKQRPSPPSKSQILAQKVCRTEIICVVPASEKTDDVPEKETQEVVEVETGSSGPSPMDTETQVIIRPPTFGTIRVVAPTFGDLPSAEIPRPPAFVGASAEERAKIRNSFFSQVPFQEYTITKDLSPQEARKRFTDDLVEMSHKMVGYCHWAWDVTESLAKSEERAKQAEERARQVEERIRQAVEAESMAKSAVISGRDEICRLKKELAWVQGENEQMKEAHAKECQECENLKMMEEISKKIDLEDAHRKACEEGFTLYAHYLRKALPIFDLVTGWFDPDDPERKLAQVLHDRVVQEREKAELKNSDDDSEDAEIENDAEFDVPDDGDV